VGGGGGGEGGGIRKFFAGPWGTCGQLFLFLGGGKNHDGQAQEGPHFFSCGSKKGVSLWFFVLLKIDHEMLTGCCQTADMFKPLLHTLLVALLMMVYKQVYPQRCGFDGFDRRVRLCSSGYRDYRRPRGEGVSVKCPSCSSCCVC
jgi:hypothetical protein